MPLNGVAFSRLDWQKWSRIFNRVNRMGSHIRIFGVRTFFTMALSKRTRMFVCRPCEKLSVLHSILRKFGSISFRMTCVKYCQGRYINRKWLFCDRENYICPKVTKMGSMIGLKIDCNGVGALRDQQHIPSKNSPMSAPPPPRVIYNV